MQRLFCRRECTGCASCLLEGLSNSQDTWNNLTCICPLFWATSPSLALQCAKNFPLSHLLICESVLLQTETLLFPSVSQILRSHPPPWPTASTGQVQLTRTHISLGLYWRGCKGRLNIWNVPFYLYFLFSFLLCLCPHLRSDPRNNPDAMRGWHYFCQLGLLHLCFQSFHLQRFANNPCTLILCLLGLHYLQRGA